jgi:sugar lactone lactonase YvrE
MRGGGLILLAGLGLLGCSGASPDASVKGTGGHPAGTGGGQAGAAAGATGNAGGPGTSAGGEAGAIVPSNTGGSAGMARTGGSGGATANGGATGQAGGGGAIAVSPALSLLAGGLGGPGNVDGTGAAARFAGPYGIFGDGAGNVYVTDPGNNTIRQIVLSTGAVTTLAGTAGPSGNVDGTGAAARFNAPTGIVGDGSGNLYVADYGNNAIRQIVISNGAVTTLVGAAGQLSGPFDVAGDGTGNLYVTDSGNQTIRKVVIATAAVTTLAGKQGQQGTANGTGAAARFADPNGIASDGAGDLYVADRYNHAVRKIVIATGAVTTFAGRAGMSGSIDRDTGTDARFNYPSDIASDEAGNLYVTDNENHTIRKIVIATTTVTTLAGDAGLQGSDDGTGGTALFKFPQGIASDGGGNLYVTDGNNTIRKVVAGTGVVTTIAGAASHPNAVDGSGADARFDLPTAVVGDGVGNLYVADNDSNTIRKVTLASGAVTTLAGVPGQLGADDGTGPAATFERPNGIAIDGTEALYVTDTFNGTIRRIAIATGAVTTFAGAAGQWNTTDGTGTDARFFVPMAITGDGAGNLYVTDSTAIRKIVIATAAVTTVAPWPGSPEDGGSPGIAADGAGNLYVADTTAIQKIVVATGAITTFAGSRSESGSADGVGADARFTTVRSLASDGAGNLYVSDGNTIRRIAIATAAVSTVVGAQGRVGVSPGALPASLNMPSGVAVLPGGALAITDATENAVLIGWLP